MHSVVLHLYFIKLLVTWPTHFLPEAKPWMDKLTVLQKLASDEGSSARIFKAIADPPTTSLQRLKVFFAISKFLPVMDFHVSLLFHEMNTKNSYVNEVICWSKIFRV